MIKNKSKKRLLLILLLLILLSSMGQVFASNVQPGKGDRDELDGKHSKVNRETIVSMYRNYYINETSATEQAQMTPEAYIQNIQIDNILNAYKQINSENSNLEETEKVKQAIKQVYPQMEDNMVGKIVSYMNTETTSNEGLGIIDAIASNAGLVVDGVVGVLFWFFRALLVLIGKIIMIIVNFFTVGSEGALAGMTIDKILFNEVPLLSINFFEQVGTNILNNETINGLRNNIAIWYTSLRNLAAVILAVMVLYVGIRMAISTAADEKARYKKMLVDWLISLILLFVLHYIIIFVIQLNNTLVDIIGTARDTNASGNYINIINQFATGAITEISFIKGWTYAIIYVILCIMTFIFLITYIKRMITIAFLIMISPIITVTYSIDKMGDGKSQALNKWFKEFVYNILIQPFQCIIYLSLVQTALKSLNEVNLVLSVICVLMIIFMYEAEDIVKKIFHFESDSIAKTIGQAALITTGLGLLGKSGSKGGSSKGRSTKRKKQPNENGKQGRKRRPRRKWRPR